MIKRGFLLAALTIFGTIGSTKSTNENFPFFAQPYLHKHLTHLEKSLVQKTLSNGLRIVILPLPETYDVYVGITYGVGSGNEILKETYGIAHVLEHMIFKGTNKLSESDIKALAEKFGKGAMGHGCNAFTSQDMTHYHFLSDKKNWPIFLDIFASSMTNAMLKQEHLDSEIKAILQEITLRKTESKSLLFSVQPNTLYSEEHPYHHPIIGYPQTLTMLTSKNLHDFYRKWYHPKNAIIIITGDINPEDALKKIEKRFTNDTISLPQIPTPPNNLPPREHFEQHNKKIYLQTTAPMLCYFWEIPHEYPNPSPSRLFLQWFLQNNLRQELVDNQHVAYSVQTYAPMRVLSNFLYIFISPLTATPEFLQIIDQQLPKSIAHCLQPTDNDLIQFKNHYLGWIVNTLDDCQQAASWANGSSFYFPTESLTNFVTQITHLTQEKILKDLGTSFSPFKMHTFHCLPISQEEKPSWVALQEKLDAYYANLSNKIPDRATPIEPPSFVNTTLPPQLAEISLPHPDNSYILSNGLAVHHATGTPSPFSHIIFGLNNAEELSLRYDTAGESMIKELTMTMLSDGTDLLNKQTLQNFFRSNGISYSFSSNNISLTCPKHLVQETLTMLTTLLSNSIYPEDLLAKHIDTYCKHMAQQQENGFHKIKTLLRNYLYTPYPWQHIDEKLVEEVLSITQNDILSCQKTILTPSNFHCVIIGDLDSLELKEILKNSLEQWAPVNNDISLTALNVPSLSNPQGVTLSCHLPLKEITLCAGRLTDYKNTPDALALKLLMQHLDKKLFEIREQSGIFYSCHANLHNSDFLTKGYLSITTTVAVRNLQSAKKAIAKTLSTITQHSFSEEEIVIAKHHALTELTSLMNSNLKLAKTYSYLLANKLNWDYFDNLVNAIKSITSTNISMAAQKYFNPSDWTFVQVGRIPDHATP